ncbi:MAG TPA: hypothetical protein VKA01_00235 [Vicinamibacteria bacterium]|nr:hypothetical protein [Vicinamibacteria bacterium]
MHRDTRETLKLLDGIKRRRVPSGPVRLSRSYLAAVEAWEGRTSQQSGADKTWVEQAIMAYRRHYAAARRSG